MISILIPEKNLFSKVITFLNSRDSSRIIVTDFVQYPSNSEFLRNLETLINVENAIFITSNQMSLFYTALDIPVLVLMEPGAIAPSLSKEALLGEITFLYVSSDTNLMQILNDL